MRRASGTIALWGVLQSILAALLWVWTSQDLTRWLLAASAAATYAAAAIAYVYGRRRGRPRALRMADASPSSALLALGVAVALLGAALGMWMVWLGAGIILVALIGLAVELAGGETGDREPAPWSEAPRGRSPTT